MTKAYACNPRRFSVLTKALGTVHAIALWALLYAHAAAQMVPLDAQQQLLEQQQQQQRRQELRTMVRQQQAEPVPSTAVAAPARAASAAAALSNSPRRLTIEEKTELRRQLARDLRVAQVAKP
jgi:hypothetical protein